VTYHSCRAQAQAVALQRFWATVGPPILVLRQGPCADRSPDSRFQWPQGRPHLAGNARPADAAPDRPRASVVTMPTKPSERGSGRRHPADEPPRSICILMRGFAGKTQRRSTKRCRNCPAFGIACPRPDLLPMRRHTQSTAGAHPPRRSLSREPLSKRAPAPIPSRQPDKPADREHSLSLPTTRTARRDDPAWHDLVPIRRPELFRGWLRQGLTVDGPGGPAETTPPRRLHKRQLLRSGVES
jgi:hypothetical protein